jgi:pimeloyl-ACP methyl ester carboxylesterase
VGIKLGEGSVRKYLSVIPLVLLICFVIGCQKQVEADAEEAVNPVKTFYKTISFDGVSIAYEMMGEGEPALVFIPGWAAPKEVWEAELSHFSPKYKSVAIDLAGVGESGNNRENWTIGAFAEDVVSVMKQIGLDNAVLIGWSMGGAVAVEVTKRMPESILGIVIVDVLHDVDKRYSEQEIINTEQFYKDLLTEPTMEKVQRIFVKNKEELSEFYISFTEKTTSFVGWWESLRNSFKWCNEECAEALKSVHVPLTSINSDQQPTNIDAFRSLVPTYKAKIMTGVGHYLIFEEPDEFKRLLEETIQEFVEIANKK